LNHANSARVLIATRELYFRELLQGAGRVDRDIVERRADIELVAARRHRHRIVRVVEIDTIDQLARRGVVLRKLSVDTVHEAVQDERGQTVYRDARPAASGSLGPVRLMCEILDYRYARTVSGARQMIDPFLYRGLWRDVQIWLPAIKYEAGDGPLEGLRAPSTVPMVLKIFPMMSWMWLGLALCLIAAATAMGFEIARAGTRQPARPPPTTGTDRSA
jgi:hypothetical protein